MRGSTHTPPDAGFAAPYLLTILGGALAVGLVIGAVLGLTGGLDLVGEPARIASAGTASYYDCPDGEILGEVTRGDRVYITARDGSGEWVQVRSPNAVEARAWMRGLHVLPDESLDALPVLACGVPVAAVIESATTSTTTVPDTTTSSTTSTTTSSTTTTSTSSTTTIPPTTTTTTVPAAPSVGTVAALEDPIWESYDGEDVCLFDPNLPATTVISAVVSAPAGVQSVTLNWSVDDEFGSIPMSLSGGQYRATLGPFDAEDPDVVPTDQSLSITITVEVLDTLQRPATAQATVTLNDCTFG